MHNFSRYPCMDLLEHILQPSQSVYLSPFLFCMKWELSHCLGMWTVSGATDTLRMALRPLQEGEAWILLRGHRGRDAGDLQDLLSVGEDDFLQSCCSVCISCACQGPDVFHVRVLVTSRACLGFTGLADPLQMLSCHVSCHIWGCPECYVPLTGKC